MSRPRWSRYATLALVLGGVACGDGTTEPNGGSSTVIVSLAGLATEDAGIVLQLTGDVAHVAPLHPSLEVAWVRETATSTTVVIVGPLSESGDVVLVERRTSGPLRAEIREVAREDGTVTSAGAAHALLRDGPAS